MLILKFFLLLILLLQEKQCSATSDISTTEFKHVAQLHDKYRLQWNFNSTHIIFRAQAQTQGYMSFGLSIKGGMYDSDIFVCTHRNTCTDRYSMETVMPKVDDSQDYHLFNDSTNGTHRTIIFGRKLQTGDNKDLDITPDTSRVIFAFGDTKNLLCHGHTNENRGTKSLYLLAYVPRESTVPDNVKTEDLLSQKGKPHTVGETLVKPAVLKMANIMVGKAAENKSSLIPLSNDTIRCRIDDMSDDILAQDVADLVTSPVVEINQIHNVFHMYVCSDGAPAMLGCNSGFGVLVKADAPHIIVTHCVLHRHVLASKTLPPKLANVLKIVVETVNYMRSRAPSHRIFKELCNEIGSEFEVLFHHSNVRWLSRGRRTDNDNFVNLSLLDECVSGIEDESEVGGTALPGELKHAIATHLDELGKSFDGYFPDQEQYPAWYKIPGESTVYSCTMFMLPNISTKHHLVKVEPVIQQGNERYVHHMILYSCRRGTKELHRTEHRCYNKNMPDDFWSCVGIIVAWAVGGQSFVYPKDVGFSLGMPDDPTIVLLEIHYDNPGRKTDGVDSSGFKLFYTPELRLIDSGILEVGADPSRLQIIPPRAASFRVYGICPTQNFGDGEQDVIYAFASLLHSHLAGTAMRLRKISGNGSISLVTEDKAYDFNFQENRFFPKPIPIRKGETLLIDCIYNTETRSNVTTGGFHTEEEMCIAYLHYYPRITLARCRSNYDATELMSDFLSANMKSKSCVVMPNTTNVCNKYLTVMSQVDWKKDTIETFQEITSRVSYEVKQYMTVTGQWQYSATKLPDFVQQEVHQRKTSSKNSKSEGAVCVLPSWWAMIVFLIVSIIMQK
uniref:uncharacterized protein n=1 Tax=Myxine glutinosa TaxID=7769 RepID=UPI00358F684C